MSECYICGSEARISDGIVGADLCDKVACLDAAWERAHPAIAPLAAEREARAWDEGFDSGRLFIARGFCSPNPYRAALAPETPEADA